MRDLKKCAEQGFKKICEAPSYYGLSASEITALYVLSSEGTQGMYEALTTAYNAGLEMGARLVKNGSKRRRRTGGA